MSKNTVLYVAIVAATGAQRFFRCGMEFTPAWKRVEVDEATVQRLREEQMLRVVDEKPADYQEPGDDGSVGAVTIGELAKTLTQDKAEDAGEAGSEPTSGKSSPSAPTTTAKKR